MGPSANGRFLSDTNSLHTYYLVLVGGKLLKRTLGYARFFVFPSLSVVSVMWDFAELYQTPPGKSGNLPMQLGCLKAASSE